MDAQTKELTHHHQHADTPHSELGNLMIISLLVNIMLKVPLPRRLAFVSAVSVSRSLTGVNSEDRQLLFN